MSRKPRALDDNLSGSSDDDAPEELNVFVTKKQSLLQAQKLRNQERISKEAERERRRKHDEMFKLQKEKKLGDINQRALSLPSDILEAVSTKSTTQSTEEIKEEVIGSSNNPGEEDAGNMDEDLEDRLSDSGVEDDSNVNEDDYIPLNSSKHGSLNVVTLQNFTRKKLSATEAALEFRNCQLFGSKGAPRETAKQRQAKRLKRRFKSK